MGELKALTRLVLSHNALVSLPSEALALPELKILKLDNNKLEDLPDLMDLIVLDQLVGLAFFIMGSNLRIFFYRSRISFNNSFSVWQIIVYS